jgi:ribokinase
MSSTPVRFLAVGDLMLDVNVSGSGHGASIDVRPGGCAANAAVWATACGAQAAVVGRVGDDLAGRSLQAALERRGVEALLTVDTELPTGTYALVDGEKRADRGANAGTWLLPERLDADAVLVSSYLEEEVVVGALARARAPWKAVQGRPLAGANAIFLNERELGDAAIEQLGRSFRLVCVTAGVGGARAVLDGKVARAQPPATYGGPATGAGDAFAAAAIVSLARGLSLQEAIDAGCRSGALAAAAPDGWPTMRESRHAEERRKETP